MSNSRFALRIIKFKARVTGDEKGVEAINFVLRNREAFETVNDFLSSQLYGSPADILKFILDNWEEILAMIKSIVDLFSQEPS